MKTFGDRLRELRTERQITGEKFGELFSVTKTAVSYWENGKSFPGEETVSKIADFFNVTTDYLLGKSDIRNPYETEEKITQSVEDDPELLKFWEELREREDLQLLFKQVRPLSPKGIKQIIKIIKAIEDEEDSEN